jgi:tripartite-type tricarboxylate transporter receptor subunit TctC
VPSSQFLYAGFSGRRANRFRLPPEASPGFRALWSGRCRRPDHAAPGGQTFPRRETAVHHRKPPWRWWNRQHDRGPAFSRRWLHSREVGNGQAISASLFEKLPYNVLTDFAPISITASFEILLAVPDNSPYKSLSEVVDSARKNPGKVTLGAINPGSTQNLSAHLFQQVTGAQYTIVPYRTTPELVTALLRESELGPGKIGIIATSGEQRDPLLKDAPTAKESGFPDYIVTSWNGLVAPAKVPGEIINILNAGVNRALTDPQLKEKALSLGIDASGSTPQQMHDRLAADVGKWRDVIEKAHIPKE